MTPAALALIGIANISSAVSITLGILIAKLPRPVSTLPAAIRRLFRCSELKRSAAETPNACICTGLMTASKTSSRAPEILASSTPGTLSIASLRSRALCSRVRSLTASPPTETVITGKSEADTSRIIGSSAELGNLTLPRSTASRTSSTAWSGSKLESNSMTRVAKPSAA